ncbi:hypothetical protein ACFPYJ_31750 [Paenibacillus solisilvae]|uniref:Cellulase Ig-like domain-containing protein n=1 Tax=Paenibacillus solisilvae TaxID=2486751 RepID=A0ABW0W5Y7_9BACL
MAVHMIQSLNGSKIAECIETPAGIQLILRGAGEASPYYAGTLDRMLICSLGKPWNDEPVRLLNPRVDSDSSAIRLSGFILQFAVTIELTFDKHHMLNVNADWTNSSGKPLSDAAVGLVFPLEAREGEKITIPHMIYNNNPSSDPERVVPKLGDNEGFVCEEHRLPIPCVNAEWTDGDDAGFISLFSIPSFTETEDGAVQYGALGVLRQGGRSSLAATSGTVLFNGQKDIYYVGKSKIAPYSGGYLNVNAGRTLSKRYALDWGKLPRSGWGFREVVRKGWQLFEPKGAKPWTMDEIIRLKTNAMDDRWRSSGGAAGYVKFNDSNDFGKLNRLPFHFLYGWTGQCLKLAWCDARIGFHLQDEERISRCEQAASFYLHGSATGVPGLRSCSYELESRTWGYFTMKGKPVVSSRAYGETISDLADIVELFREQGREVPVQWLNALREAADFFMGATLPSGIYPMGWLKDGAPNDEMVTGAGIPCVIAAAKAYKVTGDRKYLKHAEAVMERYYDLHARTFERPFARSTLDARCEDKEAGMYYFLAAYELFVLTGDSRYEEWAEVAADWLLTYVFVWNPEYDRDAPLRRRHFNAVGWPGVSVQNHHLDVFFPCYEFWRFGQMTGKTEYASIAKLMAEAMGQGICAGPGEWGFTVVGEQGEGFYQTHYHERGNSNVWNPSWVIALVLSNALRLQGEKEYR